MNLGAPFVCTQHTAALLDLLAFASVVVGNESEAEALARAAAGAGSEGGEGLEGGDGGGSSDSSSDIGSDMGGGTGSNSGELSGRGGKEGPGACDGDKAEGRSDSKRDAPSAATVRACLLVCSLPAPRGAGAFARAVVVTRGAGHTYVRVRRWAQPGPSEPDTRRGAERESSSADSDEGVGSAEEETLTVLQAVAPMEGGVLDTNGAG